MANKRFEILEAKVELLIKANRQRLSIPQFNSLLDDIIGKGIIEVQDEAQDEKDKE